MKDRLSQRHSGLSQITKIRYHDNCILHCDSKQGNESDRRGNGKILPGRCEPDYTADQCQRNVDHDRQALRREVNVIQSRMKISPITIGITIRSFRMARS